MTIQPVSASADSRVGSSDSLENGIDVTFVRALNLSPYVYPGVRQLHSVPSGCTLHGLDATCDGSGNALAASKDRVGDRLKVIFTLKRSRARHLVLVRCNHRGASLDWFALSYRRH